MVTSDYRRLGNHLT